MHLIVVAYIRIDTIQLNTTLATTTVRSYRVIDEIQSSSEPILSRKCLIHIIPYHTE